MTGKERDNETSLDHFDARFYSSQQGRFTSADMLLASGRPKNPQTWNRYVYVLNNPLALIDPTGLAPQQLPYKVTTEPPPMPPPPPPPAPPLTPAQQQMCVGAPQPVYNTEADAVRAMFLNSTRPHMEAGPSNFTVPEKPPVQMFTSPRLMTGR